MASTFSRSIGQLFRPTDGRQAYIVRRITLNDDKSTEVRSSGGNCIINGRRDGKENTGYLLIPAGKRSSAIINSNTVIKNIRINTSCCT